MVIRVGSKPIKLVCVCFCSVVSDSATPWAVAHQAPLFMEFSRQDLEWVAISFSNMTGILIKRKNLNIN